MRVVGHILSVTMPKTNKRRIHENVSTNFNSTTLMATATAVAAGVVLVVVVGSMVLLI